MRGCLVTGTDTGVGKTVVAAAIAASLRAGGRAVAAFKPVVTGLDDPPDPDWPPDHELLAAVTGEPDAQRVAAYGFGPATSPHLAAQLAGETIDPAWLRECARRRSAQAEVLVVEGVGGVLVPLAPDYLVCDLAADLGLPAIVAARPGLGTINHTLLSLEALRRRAVEIAGVVLTPWPAQPGAVELSNRETIAHLGLVEVATLRRVTRADPAALAEAGRALPLERWLGGTEGRPPI